MISSKVTHITPSPISKIIAPDSINPFHPAIIIQVFNPSLPEYDIGEIQGLVKTAGYSLQNIVTQKVKTINVKFILGAGKVASIHDNLDKFFNDSHEGSSWTDSNNSPLFVAPASNQINFPAQSQGIDLIDSDSTETNEDNSHLTLDPRISDRHELTIIFNNRLNRIQLSNLNKAWDVKVIDRDELVLEIFELHATTKESKLQIELARISLQAMIIKKEFGAHLEEKQSIARGTGKKGWEPAMRAYKERKRRVMNELAVIAQNRQIQRKKRSPFFRVGIMGYTNAGKSSLLNLLAKASVEINDQEFTTVSPTTRKMTIPKYDEFGRWYGEDILVTDSVGFISDMSPLLFDAFMSTLEELQFSHLLLIVVDLADRSIDRMLTKINTCFTVIDHFSAADIPRIFVLNKRDLLTLEEFNARIEKSLLVP